MKQKLSFLMVSLMFFGTSFLTSCGGDDNTYAPTPEDIQAAINNMAGYYTGTFVSYFISNNQSSDEITLPNLQWQANEKTITLRDFPLSALARGVQGDDQLAEAIASITEKQALILNYYLCYSWDKEYAFSLVADDIQFEVELNGKSSVVKVEFYQNPSYTNVQGDNDSQRIQIVFTSMFVDKMPVQFKPLGFTLTSTKKSKTGYELF